MDHTDSLIKNRKPLRWKMKRSAGKKYNLDSYFLLTSTWTALLKTHCVPAQWCVGWRCPDRGWSSRVGPASPSLSIDAPSPTSWSSSLSPPPGPPLSMCSLHGRGWPLMRVWRQGKKERWDGDPPGELLHCEREHHPQKESLLRCHVSCRRRHCCCHHPHRHCWNPGMNQWGSRQQDLFPPAAEQRRTNKRNVWIEMTRTVKLSVVDGRKAAVIMVITIGLIWLELNYNRDSAEQ